MRKISIRTTLFISVFKKEQKFPKKELDVAFLNETAGGTYTVGPKFKLFFAKILKRKKCVFKFSERCTAYSSDWFTERAL